MYYEDFAVGDRFHGEPIEMTEADIIAFAEQFDPQPFHVDPQVAAGSIYGGLIASGWHVISLTFGSLVRTGLFAEGGQGAPGVEELHWIKPVRPGDTVQISADVESVRPSETRNDRGYVTMRFEVTNQTGEVVSSYRCREIYRRRATDD